MTFPRVQDFIYCEKYFGLGVGGATGEKKERMQGKKKNSKRKNKFHLKRLKNASFWVVHSSFC